MGDKITVHQLLDFTLNPDKNAPLEDVVEFEQRMAVAVRQLLHLKERFFDIPANDQRVQKAIEILNLVVKNINEHNDAYFKKLLSKNN